MASLYSEADLFKSSPKHSTESNLTDSIISAEGVALSLISRFSEKHLPRASELKWLVSEQDAPQRVSINYIIYRIAVQLLVSSISFMCTHGL
jgi:run domain Beclin-1 interacting cysteine-rich containing protein